MMQCSNYYKKNWIELLLQLKFDNIYDYSMIHEHATMTSGHWPHLLVFQNAFTPTIFCWKIGGWVDPLLVEIVNKNLET